MVAEIRDGEPAVARSEGVGRRIARRVHECLNSKHGQQWLDPMAVEVAVRVVRDDQQGPAVFHEVTNGHYLRDEERFPFNGNEIDEQEFVLGESLRREPSLADVFGAHAPGGKVVDAVAGTAQDVVVVDSRTEANHREIIGVDPVNQDRSGSSLLRRRRSFRRFTLADKKAARYEKAGGDHRAGA